MNFISVIIFTNYPQNLEVKIQSYPQLSKLKVTTFDSIKKILIGNVNLTELKIAIFL